MAVCRVPSGGGVEGGGGAGRILGRGRSAVEDERVAALAGHLRKGHVEERREPRGRRARAGPGPESGSRSGLVRGLGSGLGRRGHTPKRSTAPLHSRPRRRRPGPRPRQRRRTPLLPRGRRRGRGRAKCSAWPRWRREGLQASGFLEWLLPLLVQVLVAGPPLASSLFTSRI